MPSRFKELTVMETVERYRDAGALVVVDYPGVSAEDATSIRRELREQSVDFRVVRKNLAKVAFGELGYPELSSALEGRVAIVSAEGPVEASKAAAKLSKMTKDMKFKVKGGWGDGKALSADEISTLSKIPSREALLAQIAGLAVAPLRALVGMIAAPSASLARAVKAWNEKREGGESGDSGAADAQ